MMTTVTYSVCVFLFFLLIHCLVWNISKKQTLGLYQILIVMLSTLFISTIINNVFSLFPLDIYLMTSVYFALGIIYLHFYVGITRSVSVRMLGELCRAKDHQMTFDEMEKSYSMDFMLEHRLATLVDHGWLINDRGYQCTKKGTLLAKSQLLMKKIYKIKQTG